MRPQATFSFFILFTTFFIFSLSSSLFYPRRSFLLIPPVPLSSSSLLPPRPSFLLVQHLLNHLESVKGHFSSILTKALRTNQRTDQRTDQPNDRLTNRVTYRVACTRLKNTTYFFGRGRVSF